MSVVKAMNKKQLQAAFEKTPLYQVAGKAGEAHRVFVFSAELFAESPTAPWVTLSDLGNAAGPYLEWLYDIRGSFDVVMIGDGRSRQSRKQIDQACGDCRNLHEAWVTYSPTKRLGRRVAYASDNQEVILVSMPIPRTQCKANPRSEFVAAGEETTHETTYTGVAPAPWGSLPLLQSESKNSIMGYDTEVPRAEIFDSSMGVPLFWQERKSVSCWKAILQDVSAKAVFDLTPGSGCCGRACMELGLSYAGVTQHADHCSWLQNIFDRHALRAICTSDGPLYNEELETSIKQHFEDVLQQLNDQDGAEDTEPKDEVS